MTIKDYDMIAKYWSRTLWKQIVFGIVEFTTCGVHTLYLNNFAHIDWVGDGRDFGLGMDGDKVANFSGRCL